MDSNGRGQHGLSDIDHLDGGRGEVSCRSRTRRESGATARPSPVRARRGRAAPGPSQAGEKVTAGEPAVNIDPQRPDRHHLRRGRVVDRRQDGAKLRRLAMRVKACIASIRSIDCSSSSINENRMRPRLSHRSRPEREVAEDVGLLAWKRAGRLHGRPLAVAYGTGTCHNASAAPASCPRGGVTALVTSKTSPISPSIPPGSRHIGTATWRSQ